MKFAEIAEGLGMAILVLGGIPLSISIVFLIGNLLCATWVVFSNNFRTICKTENLIREYVKNREQYMKWREEHGRM